MSILNILLDIIVYLYHNIIYLKSNFESITKESCILSMDSV